MIYELAVVVHPERAEKGVASVKKILEEVLASFNGELVLEDDWGLRSFPQAVGKGLERGHFFYSIFTADNTVIEELTRRLKINEDVVNKLVVKLGETSEVEKVKKAYANPFNVSEDEAAAGKDLRKDRKMFARKKSCWFTANKTQPDWKDPQSYTWLLNEFGKISPARVTGISRRMQNLATVSVKRARNIGMLSHVSSMTAR